MRLTKRYYSISVDTVFGWTPQLCRKFIDTWRCRTWKQVNWTPTVSYCLLFLLCLLLVFLPCDFFKSVCNKKKKKRKIFNFFFTTNLIFRLIVAVLWALTFCWIALTTLLHFALIFDNSLLLLPHFIFSASFFIYLSVCNYFISLFIDFFFVWKIIKVGDKSCKG